MKIESQVCSLELAKELKALGVKQEGTLFVYLKTKHAKGLYFATGHIQSLLNEPGHEWYAAFTVAELGEMLPSGFCTSWKLLAHDAQCIGEPRMPYGFQADTEADARAKMLIHLIKEGLL